nr:MAG TPA: hypothetical protein [Caudoviricetes sp.]
MIKCIPFLLSKQPKSIGHTANRLKNCRTMTCL